MITKQLLSISLLGTEWILYFLIALSVFSWAIIAERYLFLHRRRKDIERLNEKVQELTDKNKKENILEILKNERSSPRSVPARFLAQLTKNGKNLEEHLAIILSQERLQLESRIAFLGTIVSTAPFIGLLGTVLGIINAFHGLSVNKQGGDIVMAGISQALVATALGLFIAIPAAAAYNFFVRMVKKIIIASENFARLLIISFDQKD